MDEMERAFNFTTTALIETTRISDDRDFKQHERIILLEKKLEIIQNAIESINTFANNLKLQVNTTCNKNKNKINLNNSNLSNKE